MTQDMLEIADVFAAQKRIGNFVRKTPIFEDVALNRAVGGRLLLKFESLQIGGSFKFRGALNAVLSLSEKTRSRGVLGFSSGNHAIALSIAARMASIPATVLMPSDAPKAKQQRTAVEGAKVVLYDREKDDRESMCAGLAEKHGLALIKPYDQFEVIAGQGTLGLEIAQVLKLLGVDQATVAVPCSGGGLAAGTALALGTELPDVQVVTVEPDGFDDTKRSLEAGQRLRNAKLSGSICDALLVPEPGLLTLPILQQQGVKGVSVSDPAALAAVRWLFDSFGLIVEPGGASAVAAFLSGRLTLNGGVAVAVCSGGNMDRELLFQTLKGDTVE